MSCTDGKGLGIRKGEDVGQWFKDGRVRQSLPWVICLLHNQGSPRLAGAGSGPSILPWVGPAACCCITFLLSQKILLCLVWLLKMCLAFFLKINPHQGMKESSGAGPEEPCAQVGGRGCERPEQGRGLGRGRAGGSDISTEGTGLAKRCLPMPRLSRDL